MHTKICGAVSQRDHYRSGRTTIETMTSSDFNIHDLQGRARDLYMQTLRRYPAQLLINCQSLVDNMKCLKRRVNSPAADGIHHQSSSRVEVLGVIKAEGYGHGLMAAALCALAGGATWLASAQPREVLQLRRAGITYDRARLLALTSSIPHSPFEDLIKDDIDIAVGWSDTLESIIAASRKVHKKARIHIAVETGFGRNGFTKEELMKTLPQFLAAIKNEDIEITGIFSHFAVADSPHNPLFVKETQKQYDIFKDYIEILHNNGINPSMVHVANTAATLNLPHTWFTMVRPGIGFYGYSPDPDMGTGEDYGLKPAMTLQAQLSTVRDVDSHQAISYGRTYETVSPTNIAIVPVGYADGIHRSVSGFNKAGSLDLDCVGAPVLVHGDKGSLLTYVSGRVCMDQFMVDLHAGAEKLGIHQGNTVTLWGPSLQGETKIYQVQPSGDIKAIDSKIGTCKAGSCKSCESEVSNSKNCGNVARNNEDYSKENYSREIKESRENRGNKNGHETEKRMCTNFYPSVEEWASCARTINYDILTSLRNRIPRIYFNAHRALGERDIALLEAQLLPRDIIIS